MRSLKLMALVIGLSLLHAVVPVRGYVSFPPCYEVGGVNYLKTVQGRPVVWEVREDLTGDGVYDHAVCGLNDNTYWRCDYAGGVYSNPSLLGSLPSGAVDATRQFASVVCAGGSYSWTVTIWESGASSPVAVIERDCEGALSIGDAGGIH